MRVDGKGITPSQARPINREIDKAWDNPHAIYTESKEVFLELTDGPDCVELLVAGDVLHVHDRRSPTPVYLKEMLDPHGCNRYRISDVACGALYREAAKLSPLDRINWHDRERHLIVTALQLAAAESEDRGHADQAGEYRQIWQEYAS